MSILNKVLKTFVGDKKKKDLKLLEPVVGQVNAFEAEMKELTHDELRGKTLAFPKRLYEATKDLSNEITALSTEAHDADVDRKEVIYDEIDRLEDKSYEVSEKLQQLKKESGKQHILNPSR